MNTSSHKAALAFALRYALIAGLWILISDWAIGYLVTDPTLWMRLQLYKGWGFVVVTAAILYVILRRQLRRLKDTQNAQQSDAAEKQRLAERLSFYAKTSPTITYALENQEERLQPVWVSENIQRLLGYTPEEALDPDWWRAHLHPEDREQVLTQRDALLLAGLSLTQEYRFCHKNGNWVWLHDELNRVEKVNGNGREFVGSWTDVTQREEAEATRHYWHSLMEYIIQYDPNAIAVHDRDLKYLFVSDRYLRDYQVKEEDLIGKHHYEVFPEIPERWREVHRRVLAGETLSSEADFFRRDDGGVDHTRWECRPWYAADGTIGGLVLYTEVITERVEAERALRESRLLLRNVLDTVPVRVFWKDRNLRFLGCNLPFAQDAGLTSPEELIGKDDFEMGWKEQAERYRADDRWVIESGQPKLGYEEPQTAPNGQLVWLRTSKVPLRDAQGAIIGVLGTYEDITTQKEAEEERKRLLAEVRQQVARVQAIIDTVPEAVLLLDADGRILLANPVARRDLVTLAGEGIAEGERLHRLGDRSLAEILTSPPQGLWHEVRAENRIFQVIARPIKNGPDPERWVLVINDVTQQREISTHLQRQEQLATVGQMAAGIAHDFNNILAVIVLYAQMVAQAESLESQEREHLSTLVQEAKHATRLIQQLLDFSRRGKVKRHPLDLLPLIKEQVHLLRRTLPEDIDISLEYGAEEYAVNADPTRMQQVIMNLALNARDAMPEGGELRITVKRATFLKAKEAPLPEMKPGVWIQLRVSDTGTGIAPETLTHVFEPFFTTKEPGKGVGLGLAQVWGIVSQHEGHIDVSSTPGAGTTFTLYLPALELAPQEAASGEPPEVAPPGSGELILVVEDNASLRDALVDTLELLNYRVVATPNGRTALARLEEAQEPVALVLSDLVMPEMGGQALFHALRVRYPALPFVMLTGHPLQQELHTLRTEGLDGWLLKPVDPVELARMIASVLGQA